jgi:hypothetical protein
MAPAGASASPGRGYGVAGRFWNVLPLGGTTLASVGDDDVVMLRYSTDGQLL